MKKLYFLILTFSISVFILPQLGFAANYLTGTGVSPYIPLSGRIDNATQSWSGSLITNFDPDITGGSPIDRRPIKIDSGSVTLDPLNSEAYYDNDANKFKGFFVLTAACSTNDCTDGAGKWHESAFIAFNHGVAGKEAKLEFVSGNTYKMTGFAWSKSSGWISFDTGRNDTVKYDRLTGSFSGFAWSKNLGYISMFGLTMFSLAPNSLSNSDSVAVANHAALLGSNSGAVDGLGEYKLTIVRWDVDDGTRQLLGSSDGIFQVDIRRSMDYDYILSDPFGNTRTSILHVVANVPSDTLIGNDSGGNSLSIGTKTGTNGTILWQEKTGKTIDIDSINVDKKADGISIYTTSISLHDQYGNEIVSVNDIKKVEYRVRIENNIRPNQTSFIGALDILDVANSTPLPYEEVGRSVIFGGTLGSNFGSTPYTSTGETYTGTSVYPSGGNVSMASYMPTGVKDTLNIDISYNITSDLSDQTIQIGSGSNSNNRSFSFSKGKDDGYQIQPQDGILFGLNLPFKTTVIASGSEMSAPGVENIEKYQLYNLTSSGGSTTDLTGSPYIVLTGATFDSTTDISGKKWLFTSEASSPITLTPKVETSSISSIDFDISHQAIYTFGINGANLYAYNMGDQSSTGATQNHGIKILGSASSASGATIFALNDTDTYAKVGNFRKPQVRDMIMQNVTALRRNKPSDVYVVTNPNEKLSDIPNPGNYRTIIVEGRNFEIDQDWGNLTDLPKSLIVIGGDVIINSSVRTIYASIFTDHGLRSGGVDSYAQLYIFGTLISGNTIGTSAQLVNNVCPDFKPGCNPTDKQMYDLNFLRKGGNNPIKLEYQDYPMVIEYNPKLTSDPPPGFKKIAR